MCGSVSGRRMRVESDVSRTPRWSFESGEPKFLTYGIDDDPAWSVGLPCGVGFDVFVERLE